VIHPIRRAFDTMHLIFRNQRTMYGILYTAIAHAARIFEL